MKDCKQCGARVDGLDCPKCGYTENLKTKSDQDPTWWQCSNVVDGQRCSKPGSMSHSTRGGGPWFCRQHFFPQDATYVTRASGPRKLDAEAVAERLAIQSEGSQT